MSEETKPNDQSTVSFKSYIPATESPREFTVRAVLLGSLLGIIFAASSAYLALKVGMTVSASIPIAVLSITLFRLFGKATILENNIVQTTGSAGESIAFGIAITMPAFLLMGEEMQFARTLLVALLGSTLGILMMIPLRRGLIVKEHGKLPYPEGTACADVLIVGDQGGTNAHTVFLGFFVGAIYKFLNVALKLWTDTPDKMLRFFKGGSIGAEVSPELLGVGYIIGPRIAAITFAGGVLSYLILIPAIKIFGEGLAEPIFPAAGLIKDMTPADIRNAYVLYIGAGAVATAGIISLIKSFPTIVEAFKGGFKTFIDSRKQGVSKDSVSRTDRDLPMTLVIGGSIGLIIAMWVAPILKINLISAIIILLFGFFFVTVSSRIVGQIGSSSNPVSGMTVATLLITCLLFVAAGWTGVSYRGMALSVAAIACVAIANGGATSQDLKTGFLVGATPKYQQVAIIIGSWASALVIGWTVFTLNDAYTTIVPREYPNYVAALPSEPPTMKAPDGKMYRVHYIQDQVQNVPVGKYLVDEKNHIKYLVDPGVAGVVAEVDSELFSMDIKYQASLDKNEIDKGVVEEFQKNGKDLSQNISVETQTKGSEWIIKDNSDKSQYRVIKQENMLNIIGKKKAIKLDSPKARLFSMIVDGILTNKLPWGLVLIGIFLTFFVELLGVAALPFAVGLYLPISTTSPIMVGGVIRYLIDKKRKTTEAEAEFSPGVLLSSGYIAGGAITGVIVAILTGFELDKKFDMSKIMGHLAESNWFAMIPFAFIAYFLFWVAAKKKSAV